MTEEKPIPQLNFIERLSGVYFSPSETFVDLRHGARIALPLIMLICLTTGSALITSIKLPSEKLMNDQVERMVEEGQLTPEQAETQREQMAKFAPYAKILTPVLAVVFVILLTLAIAGVAKLVTMMMGVENSFAPLWSVTIYSLLAVSIISITLFTVILYVKPIDEIDILNPLGSNLAAILALFGVTGLPKFVAGLLSYFDIFYIWKLVLLGIGYAAVSPRLKTSMAVSICMVLGTVFAIIAAAWGAVFG
jgi:hypothetical protein